MITLKQSCVEVLIVQNQFVGRSSPPATRVFFFISNSHNLDALIVTLFVPRVRKLTIIVEGQFVDIILNWSVFRANFLKMKTRHKLRLTFLQFIMTEVRSSNKRAHVFRFLSTLASCVTHNQNNNNKSCSNHTDAT